MAAATYSLQGKTVLITGAARGIGAEAARQCAARGARVSLVGLEPDELQHVAEACGGGAIWHDADVTDSAAIEAAVSSTVEQTGGVDVVVANAGIGAGGFVRYLDPEGFARVIEVNLIGSYRTIHACLPHVIDRRGYILQNASVAALAPGLPGFAAYSSAKAGVEAFARIVGVEVGHLGVDVGVAYFGWIDTDLVRGGDEHPAAKYMRDRLPGIMGKTYPVSAAGEAIVRGIETRARSIAVPRGVKALLVLRGLLPYLSERRTKAGVAEVAALYEADLQRMANEGPVGRGGEADRRASGIGAGTTAGGS